jgi:hypothetical protein
MRKRARWIVAGVIVLAAGSLLVLLLPLMNPPAHWTRFQQLRDGMTLAEVEAALGGPAGDYQTGRFSPYTYEVDLKNPAIATVRKWTGDYGAAWVGFDQNDRVVEFAHSKVTHGNEPFSNRLRQWLRLY